MFGNFISYRLDGPTVGGPLAGDARRMAFEPAHKLLETASEAIFISSSCSEVKPETSGTSGSERKRRERARTTAPFLRFPFTLARGVPARSRSFLPLAPGERCRLADVGQTFGTTSLKLVLALDLEPFADARQHEP